MKKLITVVLILALFLPAAALADDTDPIVGAWYVYSGIVEDSQVYYEIYVFFFTDDGNVLSSKYDVSKEGKTDAKDYSVIGLWTKESGKYFVNIGFSGAQEIEIHNNSMFFPVHDSYKIRIYKMISVNYAMDFKQ